MWQWNYCINNDAEAQSISRDAEQQPHKIQAEGSTWHLFIIRENITMKLPGMIERSPDWESYNDTKNSADVVTDNFVIRLTEKQKMAFVQFNKCSHLEKK